MWLHVVLQVVQTENAEAGDITLLVAGQTRRRVGIQPESALTERGQ